MSSVRSHRVTPHGPDEHPALRLSACIIARDEERNIVACIESVAFCDEIVVVDSGSTDATVALARDAGARVIHQPWLGFAAQRNVALHHARGAWVLEIDADERVTDPLRAEIEMFLAHAPDGVDLAGLPLRDVLVGRPLGASAKYPKYRHRLLRRGAHQHDERRTVHEGIVPHGPVHPFDGDLRHELATSWGEAIRDTWRYARLEADQMTAVRSLPAIVKGVALRPAAKLAYRTVVDGGWRDGWPGMAKIGLDTAGDAIVWVRYAFAARPATGASGVPSELHYGAWRSRRGSARVIIVAYGTAATEAGRRWALAAGATGLDATLVTDAPGQPRDAPRTRAVRGARPMRLIRALAAEEQLRPIDVVVPVGRVARTLMRAVPRTLRGAPMATAAANGLPSPDEVAAWALATRPAAPPGH